MNDAAANAPSLESNRPPNERWPGSRWIAVILLALAAHLGFILTFGEIKPAAPRGVAAVPRLRLAPATDELIALNNPTLFARPQVRDFLAPGGRHMPRRKPPSFRWTEPPRWLPLTGTGLGAALGGFLQTNFFAGPRLDFKPPPELSAPGLPVAPALAPNSTMRIEGELAPRALPFELSLTNWPYPDVLPPCVVQVLVDAAGKVISAVVLPSENGWSAADHYAAADRRALELARTLRFAPAGQPAVGKIIFNWHTVPPETTTNGHE